jgi:hypothetical protein
MNVMMNMGRDGLTAQQRTEVYRRQMLVERDRLEMMHANLQIIPPDEQDDIAKALALRLDAGELAATDGVAKGKWMTSSLHILILMTTTINNPLDLVYAGFVYHR